jgi:hypothetical protein
VHLRFLWRAMDLNIKLRKPTDGGNLTLRVLLLESNTHYFTAHESYLSISTTDNKKEIICKLGHWQHISDNINVTSGNYQNIKLQKKNCHLEQ